MGLTGSSRLPARHALPNTSYEGTTAARYGLAGGVSVAVGTGVLVGVGAGVLVGVGCGVGVGVGGCVGVGVGVGGW